MQTLPVNMKILWMFLMLASTIFVFGSGQNNTNEATINSGGQNNTNETTINSGGQNNTNETTTSGDQTSTTEPTATLSGQPNPAQTSRTTKDQTTTVQSPTTSPAENTGSSARPTDTTNSTVTPVVATNFTTTENSTSSATTDNSTSASTTIVPVSPSQTTASVSSKSPSVTTNFSASTSPPSGSSPSPVSTQSSSTLSPPSVQISETNIKTWKGDATSSSWFIELSGPANQTLNGLVLRVLNAAKNATATATLLTLNLTGQLDEYGLCLLNRENSTDFENKLADVHNILMLLSVEDTATTVLDYLLYSTNSEPDFDQALAEQYQPTGTSELIVSIDSFDTTENVSLSRCKVNREGFVLAPGTQGLPNKCDLDRIQVLQMKLTLVDPNCDSTHHPDRNKLKDPLMNQIVTGVNTRRQCGFTPVMLPDFEVTVRCKDKEVEIPVTFTVHAAFQDQINAIVDGYQMFVQQTKTIVLDQLSYDVLNCTESCFKKAVSPDSDGDDKKIKVTVAVVVSCIGVFLVILLFIIVYMKRKRRGILQFRMTRLDEDDSDLIGDMDDFVGNQGPTFSSFK